MIKKSTITSGINTIKKTIKTKAVTASVAVLLTTSVGWAQPSVSVQASANPIASPLTMTTFLNTALEHNPYMRFSNQEYLSIIRQLEKTGGIDDWNLFARYMMQLGISDSFGTYNSAGEIMSSEVGVQKYLGETGANVAFSASRYSTKNYPTFGSGDFGFSVPDLYTTSFKLRLTQPLLKNSLGILTNYPKLEAKYLKKVATLKFDEDVESFKESLLGVYLDWLLTYRNTQLLIQQIQTTQQQVSLIQRQLEKGASERLELVQVKQQLKARELSLTAQKARLKTLTQQVVRVMNVPKNSMKNGETWPEKMPAESLIPEAAILSNLFASSIAMPFLGKSEAGLIERVRLTRAQETIRLQHELQREMVNTQKNALKPDLTAFIQTDQKSIESTSGLNLSDVGSKSELSAGIEFQKTLGNTAQKASLQSSKSRLEALESEQSVQMIALENAVSQLWNQYQAVNQQLQQTIELLALATESAKLEKEKYQQGRQPNLYFVLDAQDRVLGIKMSQNELENQRFKSIIALYSLLDGLDELIPLLQKPASEQVMKKNPTQAVSGDKKVKGN